MTIIISMSVNPRIERWRLVMVETGSSMRAI
jgi:hypothetical protein